MKKSLYSLLLILLVFNVSFAQEKGIKENEKYVVIEELTGTWCSWCPRGTHKGRQLSHDYDNVIFIAIHTSDPMAYSEYSEASGLTGAPSGNVNRKHFDQDTEQWESKVNQETNVNPPAYINVETTYNESTRELEAIISAEFIEDFTGNLRIGGLVLEDAVTGQSGYDQSNSYSGGGNGPLGGFENLPNPVPANMIAYDHLSRQLFGGYDGAEGSVPATVNSGETHSYTFNYTLPEEYNHEYIRVAGWLIDNSNSQILNAGKSQFLPGYDNAKPHFISEAITSGNVGIQYNYQLFTADPETDELEILAIDLPNWLTLEETDQNSIHTAGILSGIPTETGTFPITLTVTDGEWTTEQTFDLIIAANPGAGWELIGEEGFTNITSSNNTLKLDPDNVPYIAITNYGGPVEVYKFENDSWQSVGSNAGTSSSDLCFDIDSEGNPWIAYNDATNADKCVVKMFDGTNWTAIGAPVSVGGARSFGFAIDDNDIPYVGFYEQSMNAAGFVYKYEGSAWQMLGDGQIDPGASLFFNIDFLNDNTPIVLWCEAPTNYDWYSRVSKFENGSWTTLSGGNITDNNTYFYHSLAVDDNDQISVSICETNGAEYHIYQLNNDIWEDISPSETYNGENNDLVAGTDGKLYFGFQNAGMGAQTSVLQYDGSEWSSLGPVVISGVASNQTITISSNGEPYIAYTDETNGEKSTVKAYLSSDVAIANINPSSLVFPDTYIGHTAEETITISNTGNATLEIDNISSDNEIFTISSNSFSIESGESQELTIEFNPILVQEYSGIISMNSNDPSQQLIEVEVSGNGDLNIGMAEQNIDEFTIFPQPALELVYIKSVENMNTITLFNLNGQEVFKTTTNATNEQIDISELHNGIYMIQIETKLGIYNQKLIKARS